MKPGRLFRCGLLVLLALTGAASAQTASDLFSTGTLHDVFLRMNSRDLDRLRAEYEQNTYYPADLQWGAVVVRNVAIRSRGRASRSGVKLGLRVDMNYYVSGQTLVGLDALVLDNMNQDPSMLHEHAAMALFNKLGQIAPRTSFARLFINDEYQGVYELAEEPGENFVEQRIGDDNGYLFEYHRLGPYYFDDLGDDLATYSAWFEARTHERSAPSVLYAPLRELVRAIDGETLNEWRERVSAYIDLGQFVRVVAIEEFLSEVDGITGAFGMNNFYLYRPPGSDRHILIPWDRDQAFHDADADIALRLGENRFVRQALQFPDLQALYLAQITTAARAASDDDWLEGVVRAADALIADAAAADPRKRVSNDERTEAVRELVTFLRRRPWSVLNQAQAAAAALAAR